MHQHHALVVQPDSSLLRREAQALCEILNVGHFYIGATPPRARCAFRTVSNVS
jgi:hypothetical protein